MIEGKSFHSQTPTSSGLRFGHKPLLVNTQSFRISLCLNKFLQQPNTTGHSEAMSITPLFANDSASSLLKDRNIASNLGYICLRYFFFFTLDSMAKSKTKIIALLLSYCSNFRSHYSHIYLHSLGMLGYKANAHWVSFIKDWSV